MSAILPFLIKTRTCGIDTLIDRTLKYGNAIINDVFTAHISLYRVLIGRDTQIVASRDTTLSQQRKSSPLRLALSRGNCGLYQKVRTLFAGDSHAIQTSCTLYGNFYDRQMPMGNAKRSL